MTIGQELNSCFFNAPVFVLYESILEYAVIEKVQVLSGG